MEYHRINVEREGKTYFRKRSGPTAYLERVPRLGPSAAFSQEDNYFVLEQAFVDGTLPDPSLKWEATGQWIAPYQWDMLIYMWSNADIATTSISFSGLAAARKYTRLNADIRGQRKEQGRRKSDLFLGLERAGLVEVVRRSPNGLKVYRELKLAPVWLYDGLVPSGIPRTWANLSASDRKWFKMPMAPFTQPDSKKGRCPWALISHVDRRALAALYLFFNDKEFGAVDPNHVCLRGEELVISDAFRRAVGRRATPSAVAEALGELWRRELIDFLSADLDDDRPYPASPTHVRFATRSATSADALVGLHFVPRPGQPTDAVA